MDTFRPRTRTREIVLQSLHATEGGTGHRLQDELHYLLNMRNAQHAIDKRFANALVTAIGEFRGKVIELVGNKMNRQWRNVDVILRAVLIQGGSEMLADLTEPRIAINEYVTLGKRFGNNKPDPSQTPFWISWHETYIRIISLPTGKDHALRSGSPRVRTVRCHHGFPPPPCKNRRHADPVRTGFSCNTPIGSSR